VGGGGPAAAPPPGPRRVALFLGSRDNGGLFIGSTVPVEKQFRVTAAVPSSANGGRDLVAYAYSSVNGQETSVSVPVFIGAAPTATPTTSSSVVMQAPAMSESSSCPALAPAEGGAAMAAPAAASAAAPVMAAGAAPFLQLANPSAGALLPTGDIVITGSASDPAAMSGAGIDRVELFLDPRENGGLFLGSVDPSGKDFKVVAAVPNSANGGHTLTVYARSSVTGREAVQQVPVFVGEGPTPTPRPATS